jgi:hypothetical protein
MNLAYIKTLHFGKTCAEFILSHYIIIHNGMESIKKT